MTSYERLVFPRYKKGNAGEPGNPESKRATFINQAPDIPLESNLVRNRPHDFFFIHGYTFIRHGYLLNKHEY